MKGFSIPKVWIYIFMAFLFLIPLVLLENRIYLILMICCILLVYKYDIPKYGVLIFGVALVARIYIILSVPTPPQSDFALLLDAFQKLLIGDLSYLDSVYFQNWAYQIGFVWFQSFFLRIWNDVLILKLLNCVMAAGTTTLVYLLSKEFVDKKAAQFVSVVYCWMPFTLTYVTVLSNQFVATFAIFMGIYILVAKNIQWNDYIRYGIFTLLLVIANVMRPESIIPLCAIILFLLLTIRKSDVLKKVTILLMVIVEYVLLFFLIERIFIGTGISSLGLSNNWPILKFLFGFNHETSGGYSTADTLFMGNDEGAMQELLSRISVPFSQLLRLFKNKIRIFWDGGTVHWALNVFRESELNLLGRDIDVTSYISDMDKVNSIIMIVVYVLAAIGVLNYVKGKYRKEIIIIVNQVFVTFGV